jgi:hypothetical protein
MIGESWHSRIDGNINRILSVVTEDKKKDELINKQSEALTIMKEALERLQSWSEDDGFNFGKSMTRNLAIEALEKVKAIMEEG